MNNEVYTTVFSAHGTFPHRSPNLPFAQNLCASALETGVRAPRSGIIIDCEPGDCEPGDCEPGDCEPFDEGAGNGAQVLCKSSSGS